MATVSKKENLTISIREYQDNQGQTKKVWKTIGELITWDDGKQSFEMWGPTGATKGSVFSQDNNQQQGAQQGQQQQQQPNGIIPAKQQNPNTPISNGGYQQQPATANGGEFGQPANPAPISGIHGMEDDGIPF